MKGSVSDNKFDLYFCWLIMQTEQMGRIVNELDSIQFSIKKASQLVKEIGRQVDWFSLLPRTIYFPSNLSWN